MSDVKSFHLTEQLHSYLVEHATPLDEVQKSLIAETKALGDIAIMQIAPEQGGFMALITQICGARSAVEVGVFTGYSALSVARALPADGTLLCLDVSEEWTAIGKRHWEMAGVAEKIDLRLGPAAESLAALPVEPMFDLAFIDADKGGYTTYYEEILKRMPAGGLILVDNVLWFGMVADPSVDDEQTNQIRAFNDHVASDERVDCSMIAVGDGISLIRKR